MNDQPSNSGGRARAKAKQPSAKSHPGERIAKIMARAGLCSRRDAEAWIAAGRVSVNGQALTSPAFNVTAQDDIRIDGAPLARRERTRLFLFHKPCGLVTTARDPEGRRTIFDALPEGAPRLIAVGRLDINSEGLLLLTNDGGLARVLELPATGWLRRYRVRAHGAIDQAALDSLAGGVAIDGVLYAGIEARLDRMQGANVWLTMALREGKNREIKRVLEHLGLAVNRLIRVSFGPFQLGDLEEGVLVELPTRVVRDQIGPRLARESGADFDAPLREKPRSEARENPARPRGARAERPASRSDERRRARPPIGASLDKREAAPPREERRPQRKRKYFAALRAERDEAGHGPRRRLERGAISDRRGREIAIERVNQAEQKESRGEAARDARRSRFRDRAPQERFPREPGNEPRGTARHGGGGSERKGREIALQRGKPAGQKEDRGEASRDPGRSRFTDRQPRERFPREPGKAPRGPARHGGGGRSSPRPRRG